MTAISIVTISFNQDRYLKDCLESVVSQLSDRVQYIVVDPGSNDGSRERIESYGDVLTRVFVRDKGPADGLNNGFARATGRYLFFLNADDVLLPGAIEIMLRAIDGPDPADVYCFGGYLVDADLRRLRAMRTFRFSAQRFCRGNTSIYQQGMLFSAEMFAAARGFNMDNRTCWDAELAVEMSLARARFEDRPERISYFRIHGTSITGSATNHIENKANKDRLYEKVFMRKPGLGARITRSILRFEKYFYSGYLIETVKLHVAKASRQRG